MKYCFRSSLVRKQIQSTASYTTRALTNGQLLSNVLLLLPEPEEQTAIATILSDMDNEIQTLEQRLSKTRQIKQGMMQELLTGKTRLPFARLAGESDAD
jgi:type I restriction enzyme S subunit